MREHQISRCFRCDEVLEKYSGRTEKWYSVLNQVLSNHVCHSAPECTLSPHRDCDLATSSGLFQLLSTSTIDEMGQIYISRLPRSKYRVISRYTMRVFLVPTQHVKSRFAVRYFPPRTMPHPPRCAASPTKCHMLDHHTLSPHQSSLQNHELSKINLS